jgi:hypothetical protein
VRKRDRLEAILARVPPLARRLRNAEARATSGEAARDLRSSMLLALRCADLVLDLDAVLEEERPASRATATDVAVLDIGRLVAQGFLARGRQRGSLGGRTPSASVAYELSGAAGERKLALGAPLNQTVAIAATRPTFGGTRYWFRCPRCGRRTLHLYLPQTAAGFACRTCHRLDRRVSAPKLRGTRSWDLADPEAAAGAKEPNQFTPGPSHLQHGRPRRRAG